MKPETKEWHELGKALDDIHDALDEAIHGAFCKEKWILLDKKLALIAKRATSARCILRPRSQASNGDPETIVPAPSPHKHPPAAYGHGIKTCLERDDD